MYVHVHVHVLCPPRSPPCCSRYVEEMETAIKQYLAARQPGAFLELLRRDKTVTVRGKQVVCSRAFSSVKRSAGVCGSVLRIHVPPVRKTAWLNEIFRMFEGDPRARPLRRQPSLPRAFGVAFA